MPVQPIEAIAAALFAAALLHTFATRLFATLARRHPRHAGLFNLLGEVEVVFGFWAMLLIVAMALVAGAEPAVDYAESREYGEPLFVFVIMVVAASRPVLELVQAVLRGRRCGCLAAPRSRRSGWAWRWCRCSDRSSPSRPP